MPGGKKDLCEIWTPFLSVYDNAVFKPDRQWSRDKRVVEENDDHTTKSSELLKELLAARKNSAGNRNVVQELGTLSEKRIVSQRVDTYNVVLRSSFEKDGSVSAHRQPSPLKASSVLGRSTPLDATPSRCDHPPATDGTLPEAQSPGADHQAYQSVSVKKQNSSSTLRSLSVADLANPGMRSGNANSRICRSLSLPSSPDSQHHVYPSGHTSGVNCFSACNSDIVEDSTPDGSYRPQWSPCSSHCSETSAAHAAGELQRDVQFSPDRTQVGWVSNSFATPLAGIVLHDNLMSPSHSASLTLSSSASNTLMTPARFDFGSVAEYHSLSPPSPGPKAWPLHPVPGDSAGTPASTPARSAISNTQSPSQYYTPALYLHGLPPTGLVEPPSCADASKPPMSHMLTSVRSMWSTTTGTLTTNAQSNGRSLQTAPLTGHSTSAMSSHSPILSPSPFTLFYDDATSRLQQTPTGQHREGDGGMGAPMALGPVLDGVAVMPGIQTAMGSRQDDADMPAGDALAHVRDVSPHPTGRHNEVMSMTPEACASSSGSTGAGDAGGALSPQCSELTAVSQSMHSRESRLSEVSSFCPVWDEEELAEVFGDDDYTPMRPPSMLPCLKTNKSTDKGELKLSILQSASMLEEFMRQQGSPFKHGPHSDRGSVRATLTQLNSRVSLSSEESGFLSSSNSGGYPEHTPSQAELEDEAESEAKEEEVGTILHSPGSPVSWPHEPAEQNESPESLKPLHPQSPLLTKSASMRHTSAVDPDEVTMRTNVIPTSSEICEEQVITVARPREAEDGERTGDNCLLPKSETERRTASRKVSLVPAQAKSVFPVQSIRGSLMLSQKLAHVHERAVKGSPRIGTTLADSITPRSPSGIDGRSVPRTHKASGLSRKKPTIIIPTEEVTEDDPVLIPCATPEGLTPDYGTPVFRRGERGRDGGQLEGTVTGGTSLSTAPGLMQDSHARVERVVDRGTNALGIRAKRMSLGKNKSLHDSAATVGGDAGGAPGVTAPDGDGTAVDVTNEEPMSSKGVSASKRRASLITRLDIACLAAAASLDPTSSSCTPRLSPKLEGLAGASLVHPGSLMFSSARASLCKSHSLQLDRKGRNTILLKRSASASSSGYRQRSIARSSSSPATSGSSGLSRSSSSASRLQRNSSSLKVEETSARKTSVSMARSSSGKGAAQGKGVRPWRDGPYHNRCSTGWLCDEFSRTKRGEKGDARLVRSHSGGTGMGSRVPSLVGLAELAQGGSSLSPAVSAAPSPKAFTASLSKIPASPSPKVSAVPTSKVPASPSPRVPAALSPKVVAPSPRPQSYRFTLTRMSKSDVDVVSKHAEDNSSTPKAKLARHASAPQPTTETLDGVRHLASDTAQEKAGRAQRAQPGPAPARTSSLTPRKPSLVTTASASLTPRLTQAAGRSASFTPRSQGPKPLAESPAPVSSNTQRSAQRKLQTASSVGCSNAQSVPRSQSLSLSLIRNVRLDATGPLSARTCRSPSAHGSTIQRPLSAREQTCARLSSARTAGVASVTTSTVTPVLQ